MCDTYPKSHDKKSFSSRYKALVIVQTFKVLNVLGCHHCSFGIKTMIIVNTLEERNSHDYKGKEMKFSSNGIKIGFGFSNVDDEIHCKEHNQIFPFS